MPQRNQIATHSSVVKGPKMPHMLSLVEYLTRALIGTVACAQQLRAQLHGLRVLTIVNCLSSLAHGGSLITATHMGSGTHHWGRMDGAVIEIWSDCSQFYVGG